MSNSKNNVESATSKDILLKAYYYSATFLKVKISFYKLALSFFHLFQTEVIKCRLGFLTEFVIFFKAYLEDLQEKTMICFLYPTLLIKLNSKHQKHGFSPQAIMLYCSALFK